MSRGKRKSGLDPLLFIDTNIYLDFYRARDKSFEVSMINHIDENRGIIISTEQVFMEFKKNRQKTILEVINGIKEPNVNIIPPTLLSDANQVKMINKAKVAIQKQTKALKNRINNILKNPTTKDPVYQCLHRLVKANNKFHLDQNNELMVEIINLAKKRFIMGYPPKKNDDISIGDAINWEWIIDCANKSGKDIIIVSRDKDYGETFEDHSIINDWLNHEFKNRISKQRKIILTAKLSLAFKLANVSISVSEEKNEEKLITDISKSSYYKSIMRILNAYKEDDFTSYRLIYDELSKKDNNSETDG